MKNGWYLDFLKGVVYNFLDIANISNKETIFYYFVNDLLSKNLLKVKPKPTKTTIEKYLKNYLKNILEFYTNKHNYLNHKSRELYYMLHKQPCGNFLWSILEHEKHYEVLFYTSLTSDPYLYAPYKLYIPKLSDKDISALMEVVYMEKLVEYVFEKPVSLCIDGKILKKIVKIPAIDPSWDCVEMFSKIDKINIYVNNYYICSFSIDDTHVNFIHYVTKIQLMYFYTTKRYHAKIYVNLPEVANHD